MKIRGREKIARSNIVSVSFADHLTFGEDDGKLTSPDAVHRRMERWRDELGASVIHWRLLRTYIKGRFYAERGRRHPTLANSSNIKWNDLDVVPQLAHETGMKAYLYVSLFDEGWPILPKKVRKVSFHNEMHGQHVSWQSEFSHSYPEYAFVGRNGSQYQWGVLCLAYPEVRAHFLNRFEKLIKGREFDGLFLCLRSQSRPADFADQYGFNDPVCLDYMNRYGKDIRKEDFDLQAWRDLLGSYLTTFLTELGKSIRNKGCYFAVGIPRGDILGPPFGNTTLKWRQLVQQGIVDELIVNQNSSQCPSMWHQLWPMHRGYGYLQNYLNGYNTPPLLEYLKSAYRPVFSNRKVKLYVAWQWNERSAEKEFEVLEDSNVTGLVYSSFRHDNPGPVARGDWRA